MSSGAAAAAALKDLTAVDEWPRNVCAVCGELHLSRAVAVRM